MDDENMSSIETTETAQRDENLNNVQQAEMGLGDGTMYMAEAEILQDLKSSLDKDNERMAGEQKKSFGEEISKFMSEKRGRLIRVGSSFLAASTILVSCSSPFQAVKSIFQQKTAHSASSYSEQIDQNTMDTSPLPEGIEEADTQATQQFIEQTESSQESSTIDTGGDGSSGGEDVEEDEATPQQSPTPIAPTQEEEQEKVSLGITNPDLFYRMLGYTVDQLFEARANDMPDYTYQYFLYTDKEEYVNIFSGEMLRSSSMESSFYESIQKAIEGNKEGRTFTVTEQDIFELVMQTNSFSSFSVQFFHQMALLITEEVGEDDIVRNGFFAYGKLGPAIYIDEDNRVNSKAWREDQIDSDIPEEVQHLFNQGYTQVRKIGNKYFGMFHKDDLCIRSNISIYN